MNLADAMANQRAMLEAQQTMLGALFRIEDSPLTQKAIADQFGDDFRSIHVKTNSNPGSTTLVTQSEPNSRPRNGPTYSSFMQRTRFTNACPPGCVCTCHKPRYTAVNGMFSSIIGSGSIQTKSTAFPGLRCTVTKCRPSAATSLTISYRLPSWFAARVIYLWYTSSPLGSPEVVIRVPRVFTWHSEVWTLICHAMRSDVVMLRNFRSMVVLGLISPYDELPNGLPLVAVCTRSMYLHLVWD